MKTWITWAGAALAGTLLSTLAFAAEYYPSAISLRTFGTDQGNVGDCMTGAQLSALETAFASRGWNYVKLSPFYRHAAIWEDKENKDPALTKLEYTQADRDLIHRAGPLLPDYMWPEDAEGFDPSRTGMRPHVAEALAWDPEFPNASSLGFQDEYLTFEPGYSNTATIDRIKGLVAGANAVTISMHGDLLQPIENGFQWDHVTGLQRDRYDWSRLVALMAARGKDVQKGLNHALAIVGYDDSLYADRGYAVPGAFIIRNSWNSGDMIDAALREPSPQQAAELARMRLKVYGTNVPGFYALPYQYVQDLLNNHVGAVHVFHIDFAAFASAYLRFSGRYELLRTPFVCDTEIIPGVRSGDPARKGVRRFGARLAVANDASQPADKRGAARRDVYQMALREQRNRSISSQALFRFAKIPQRQGEGFARARAFYEGQFRAYYCPGQATDAPGVWPSVRELDQAAYQRALLGLRDDPSTPAGWYGILAALAALTP